MNFLLGFTKTAAPRHHKRLQKAIEGKQDIHITYRKKNGRTAKRKVTPYDIKGHLLVGHDHKRGEIRSYIIKNMKEVKV